jgi:hypothetical protein
MRMKKALIALMLLLGALAFAQDSEDDFFSNSDDSVLDKARQKYEQRQSDDEVSADKQRAEELVKGEDTSDDQAVIEDDSVSESEEGSPADYIAADDDETVAESAESAEADPPDRYRVKREMIVDLFGMQLILTIEKDPNGKKTASGTVKSGKSERDEETVEKTEAPYSPFVISLLPGISIPFGTYKTNMAIAAIGGITAEVKGIAASGIFDIISGDLLGLQTAGIFTVVGGDAMAIQSSGIFGIVSGTMTGIQAAGICNVAGGDVKGLQTAGIFNMGRDLTGVQAAGIFNTARQVKGVQVAGIGNIANDVTGAQVAGIINIASEVKGTQIGLINISKEMYGLPIGLFNFTLNGIRDIGFWQDSSNSVYAFWSNGTNNFYTILYAGESLDDWFRNTDTIAAGGGAGVRLIEKPLRLDLDLSAKHYYGPRFAQNLALAKEPVATTKGAVAEASSERAWTPSPVFPSLRLSLGLPLFSKFEVFCGASADMGIEGLCAIPEEIASDRSFHFQAFGSRIDVSPQLYWGLRF